MPDTPHPSRLRRFWRERVVALIVAQFTQGVTVQRMALTIALGMTLAVFPILGTTTVLCAIAALWLRLNQPVIQVVNYLMYPLQIILIVVFVRIGECIMRAAPVSFSIPEMLRKFHESPVKFMHEFGLTGLHAIIAWLLIAPLLVTVLYWTLRPPLGKLAQLTAKKA